MRRAARVGVPLTEYNWGGAFNITYVPAYGKFAGFGDFIFHYDVYVVGGSWRHQHAADSGHRSGQPLTSTGRRSSPFNAGIGLRIFFNRWFAAMLEVRDYIFKDKLENIANSWRTPSRSAGLQDTWYGDNQADQRRAGAGRRVDLHSVLVRVPVAEVMGGAANDGKHHDENGNLAQAALLASLATLGIAVATERAEAQEILLTGPSPAHLRCASCGSTARSASK